MRQFRITWQAIILGLASSANGAMAQDAGRGRELYETHCGACHYERVHQRDRARSLVQTLPDLRDQVRRWAGQAGKPLTADDLNDIAEYLNRSHYRLDK